MKVDSHGCYGFLFPGTTEDESQNNFKRYLYNTLCQRTPLHEEENGVHLKIVGGVKVYSHDCVHRLVKEEQQKSCPLPPAEDEAASSANRKVVRAVEAQRGRRKRGAYVHNDDEGNTRVKTETKQQRLSFLVSWGPQCPNLFVRNVKKKYLQRLQEEPDPDKITSLPHGS
jgi:hypothetical protein